MATDGKDSGRLPGENADDRTARQRKNAYNELKGVAEMKLGSRKHEQRQRYLRGHHERLNTASGWRSLRNDERASSSDYGARSS